MVHIKRKNIQAIMLFLMLFSFFSYSVLGLIGCSDDDPPPAPPQEEPFEAGSKKENKAPLMQLIGDKVAMVGSELKFRVHALDTPDDFLTFKCQRMITDDDPPTPTNELLFGMDFNTDIDESNAAEFSWKPLVGQLGDHYLLFTVEDSGEVLMSDSEIVKIRVYPDDYKDEELKVELYPISGKGEVNLGIKITRPTESSTEDEGTTLSKIYDQETETEKFDVVLQEEGADPNPANSEVCFYPFAYEHYTILYLDFSGTMIADGGATLDAMIEAAKRFVRILAPTGEKIAINYFNLDIGSEPLLDDKGEFLSLENFTSLYGSGDPVTRLLMAESKMIETIDAKLDSLKGKTAEALEQSTNLYRTFQTGTNVLTAKASNWDKSGFGRKKGGAMVVFTNGKDTTGNPCPTLAPGSDHDIFAIGLGTAPYENLDENLGILAGANFYKSESDELNQIFETVAGKIASKAREEKGKWYYLTYYGPTDGGLSRRITVTVTDAIGRTGKGFDADKYPDGEDILDYGIVVRMVEKKLEDLEEGLKEVKLSYYDFDKDGYYSIGGGEDSLYDFDDYNPYKWNDLRDLAVEEIQFDEEGEIDCTATVGCMDFDGDGYYGCGCDLNLDCDDEEPGINPNMVDDSEDGFDQDCDGRTGPVSS